MSCNLDVAELTTRNVKSGDLELTGVAAWVVPQITAAADSKSSPPVTPLV